MQDSLVVHVEDGEGELRGPVDDLGLLQPLPVVHFLLLGDELAEVSALAELHDDVELLALADAFAVGDDVDVLEVLQQLHLVEDVLGLLLRLVRQLDLLYYEFLIFFYVVGEVGVTEGA